MSSNPTKRNNLVALGSAAVLAVYAAGYVRTRSAAELYANESNERRPVRPTPRLAVELPATPTVVVQAPIAEAPPSDAAPAKPALKAVATVREPGRNETSPVLAPPTRAPDSVVTAAPPIAVPISAPVPAAAPPAPAPPAAPSPDSLRAAAAADSAAKADSLKSHYKDGYYRGYGTSRHGDIEAEVQIAKGKIVYARISRCLTRYSCSWIDHLPDQVVARQSADVDYVSGATQSSDAFYIAVMQALSKAK